MRKVEFWFYSKFFNLKVYFLNKNVLVNRMFLFNRIKINEIRDQTLSDRLKKWFRIGSQNHNSQPTLFESKYRMLDEMEIKKLESFEFDFNFSENPVQTSQRLS